MSVMKSFRLDEITIEYLTSLVDVLGINQAAVMTDLLRLGNVLAEKLKLSAPESARNVSVNDFLLEWSALIALEKRRKQK